MFLKTRFGIKIKLREKIRKTKTEERYMMFGKSEKKKSAAPFFLTIGALAVIGAASITNKGKRILNSAVSKMKSVMPTDE